MCLYFYLFIFTIILFISYLLSFDSLTFSLHILFYTPLVHTLFNQSTRHESQIFHMRNLNNWVKSQLIEKTFELSSSPSSSSSSVRGKKNSNGISVLDFCCGKGGDLFKWLKSPKGGEMSRNGRIPYYDIWLQNLYTVMMQILSILFTLFLPISVSLIFSLFISHSLSLHLFPALLCWQTNNNTTPQ